MDGSRARALLRVRPHASTDEIRDAFRRAVRAAHPDRGGDAGTFRALVATREVLLATASAGARPWPTVGVRCATVDLVDVVRPRPAPSAAPAPAPAFEAVLASMLAA